VGAQATMRHHPYIILFLTPGDICLREDSIWWVV
jgi:hypothetical protein